VPEHKWPREDGVADAGLVEPVPVGAAQADGGYAHEDFACSGVGRRLVVKTKVVDAVESENLHGCP
jgi:hypothetical protein